MKRIGLVSLMIAGMICMTQSVYAYTFVNNSLVAVVAADGEVTDLSINKAGANDVVDTMYATISYALTSGGAKVSKTIGDDFANMWTASTVDGSPELNLTGLGVAPDYLEVKSLYRISPRGTGDTLDVKVSTKLEDGSTYLAQRYWVEYDENGGADLFDVNIELTIKGNYAAAWVGVKPPIGPLASDWGSTSNWPNPVDTAHIGPLRTQGYVPGIPDGAHIITPTHVTMDWDLGNLGNSPAPATVGALEIRTDVVPEPCTMALMGAGLLGLFGVRRRKA